MDALSTSWWDSKTLTLDGVDTRDYPGIPRLNWVRWRLIDELLRRYYQDIGLEIGFGQLGVELYNDPIWSPNCKRAPRYFGRLCAHHVHSSMTDKWDELRPSYGGGTQDFLLEGVWPTWTEYLQTAIQVLGLASSGVPGHEGCWHRRAKAVFPLVFRVALLLRTAGEVGPVDLHDGMYTYPGAAQEVDGLEGVLTLLEQQKELTGATPRGLVVRRNEEPWIAIRSDGFVLTRHGTANIREMWQQGEDEWSIARRIQTLAHWGENPQYSAENDEVLNR
jgi:hypothetical protein